MSKAPKEKQTVESLLEREKNKNRRIVTAVFITLAFFAGFITSYFVMRGELANVQANAISAYTHVAESK